MSFKKKQRESLRLDLTPMVDVVFLLLIFFMISTSFVDPSGLSIDLPQSSAQKKSTESIDIKVFVSHTGEIEVDQTIIGLDEFQQKLSMALSQNPDTALIIHADEQTDHGRVVQIMDRARSAGIKKMAIATKPRQR